MGFQQIVLTPLGLINWSRAYYGDVLGECPIWDHCHTYSDSASTQMYANVKAEAFQCCYLHLAAHRITNNTRTHGAKFQT